MIFNPQNFALHPIAEEIHANWKSLVIMYGRTTMCSSVAQNMENILGERRDNY